MRGAKALGGSESAPLQGFFYFSVTCLTTLGFGDVTPATPAARMVVMLEAMVGQLFMAVFVARLVGGWRGAGPPSDRTPTRE